MVNSLSGGLLLSLIHTEISTPGFLRNFMRRPLLVGSGDPGVGHLVKNKMPLLIVSLLCVSPTVTKHFHCPTPESPGHRANA